MKHGKIGKCFISIFAAAALLGATVPALQTKADDATPVTFEAEKAEKSQYATTYNNSSASGGQYVGGANYDGKNVQTYSQIVSDGYVDKCKMPYIQYTVDAAAAGEYQLIDRYRFTGTYPASCFILVIVDGTVYQVPYDKEKGGWQEISITVRLNKGRNVILSTDSPKDFVVNGSGSTVGWVDQDCIRIYGEVFDPSKYSPAETVATPVTQEAEDLTYFGGGYHTTDFSAAYNGFYSGNKALSLSTDSSSPATVNHGVSAAASLGIGTADFSAANMDRVPYCALTVNATTEGYYTVSASARINNGDQTSGNLTGHVCVLVNGKKQIVPFYSYPSNMASSGDKRYITAYVSLQPGNNELVFSGVLSDTFTSPVSAAKEWIDFDSFLLSGGLKVANTQANPHSAVITSKLTDNALDVTINNPNPACQYQVWCYSKIGTDTFGTESSDQYSWVLWKTFASNQYTVPVTDPTTDPDGNYRVMVLTLDNQGNVVDQNCNNVLVLTGEQSGAAKIRNVFFDGKAVSDAASVNCGDGTVSVAVPIKVVSSNADRCTLSYYDGTQDQTISADLNGDVANATVDFKNFQPGTYKFTAQVENSAATDSQTFYVKVYSYDSNQIQSVTYPEIESLSGSFANNSINVALTAPEGKATLGDQFHYFFSLSEPGRAHQSQVVGSLPQATLTSRGYGMYAVYGTAGHSRSGYDDVILQYINNPRPSDQGTLSVSSLNVTSGDGTVDLSNATLNTTYKIRANVAATGAMAGQLENVKYSFWRNDARGWVLIKDWCAKDAEHPDADTLNWTPASIGKYDIQVRIQGPDAGSYEALKDVVFEVKDSAKTAAAGVVSVQVPGTCTARTPVEIAASVTGASAGNLLYRFDIYDSNLGSSILQAYSPNNTCTFIPRKATTYTMTVKVISQDSFGMYDIESAPTDIVVN